jgi:hypothetical protein
VSEGEERSTVKALVFVLSKRAVPLVWWLISIVAAPGLLSELLRPSLLRARSESFE